VSAVPADPPDEAVAGNSGDPYAEQRALAGGVRRDWAWPEVVALGAAVLALVVSLLV
jgi:hypothetical protein